ncbi:MAG: hypothetical protein ACI8Z0_002878 [Lentimonas sp.]
MFAEVFMHNPLESGHVTCMSRDYV